MSFAAAGRRATTDAYMRFVENIYKRGYHSLSSSKATASRRSDERLGAGTGDPPTIMMRRQKPDALAARGYWQLSRS